MGNCLNARNLPRGGLSFAHGLASHLPAIALVYGATDQSTECLTCLPGKCLRSGPPAEDLAALCDAFSARAMTRNNGGRRSAAP